MNPVEELLHSMIENPIKTVVVVLFFVVIFMMYQGLEESPLMDNEHSREAIESGKEATWTLFNGWMIAGSIGFLVLLVAAGVWIYREFIE